MKKFFNREYFEVVIINLCISIFLCFIFLMPVILHNSQGEIYYPGTNKLDIPYLFGFVKIIFFLSFVPLQVIYLVVKIIIFLVKSIINYIFRVKNKHNS